MSPGPTDCGKLIGPILYINDDREEQMPFWAHRNGMAKNGQNIALKLLVSVRMESIGSHSDAHADPGKLDQIKKKIPKFHHN